MEDLPLWVGTAACCTATAAALAPLPPRHRLAMLSVALLIAPVIVLADNWHGERVREVRESPALALAALAGAAALVATIGRLMAARPALLPLALIGTMPFRIPVDLAGTTANLLLPLYGVLAAGVAAAWLRPERILSRELPRDGPVAWLGWALAVFVAAYGLQAAWADDLSGAVETAGFFLAPFAALYLLLASHPWDRDLARLGAIVLVAEMGVVALVGFGQYATGELFWNEKVIAGNEAHAWFRVNSLFYDPNIMGRYLAVAMIALAGVAAWARGGTTRAWSAAAFGALLAALAITFSQTSFIALVAGLLALGLVRWGPARASLAAAGVVVVLAATALAIGPGDEGLADEGTGRVGLVSGGLELAADRPLAGYGSGSFPDEFEQRFGGGEGISVVSHTEPVTVAAEQGAIGMLPYLAVLAAGLGVLGLSAGVGRAPPGGAVPACLLAGLVVMIVHSIGYAAFFTDPLTWALLALGAAAYAAGGRGGREPRNAGPGGP